MASIIRQIDDSDYEVKTKYRLFDVVQNVLRPKLDESIGAPSSQILQPSDLEQMLNAYLDEKGVWNINLNSSFYVIGMPEAILKWYKVPDDMRWPTISYNIYGTTRLAWLLMKLNNVTGKDIFKPIRSGNAIAYLDKTDYVDKIIASIQEMEGPLNG